MYSEDFMRRAIELSAQALETEGTEPFGAVVVKDGNIVGEGINRSALKRDPTSHGETEAIRDACHNLQTVDLSGCELYTSCEPCALCVAAMEIAGIARLYYACDLQQANSCLGTIPASVRFPIDSIKLRKECGKAVADRVMPSRQLLSDEAQAVLVAWAKRAAGTGGG
jgi:tRNA(Arg) A34 adenosine deaminase TadA